MAQVSNPFKSGDGMSEFMNVLSVPKSFQIHEVDGLTSKKPYLENDVNARTTDSFAPETIEGAPEPTPGELNILALLYGEFHGAGLNMIFRPSFGNVRRNNVLEYNVTEEAMTFLQDIGDVPNRGLGKQRDVIIKAVPYNQMVNDLLNKETGKADRKKPIGIHYETGLFLRTPPTDVRPVVKQGTIARLASIPHGTTINCQGIEPDMLNPKPGPPEIGSISIVPFPSLHPGNRKVFAEFFPQLDFTKDHNLRIPRGLVEGGALTEALVNNPNILLTQFNENSSKKRIIDHYTFTLNSDERISKIPGGGTANTGYLTGARPDTKGSQNPGPNANGVTVEVTYWISNVEYDVLIPEGDWTGDKTQFRVLESEARKEERDSGKRVISPSFHIKLNQKIAANTVRQFKATQIQYSQDVTLDFDSMGWPHVSVGTLLPSKPVPVFTADV